MPELCFAVHWSSDGIGFLSVGLLQNLGGLLGLRKPAHGREVTVGTPSYVEGTTRSCMVELPA